MAEHKFTSVERHFEITRLYSTFEHHWNSEFCFNGESHDFWEIVYVDSGRVEAVADDRVYLLDGGNILFHSPMTFHTIRSADGTSPHARNLSFSTRGTPPANLSSGVFTLSHAEREEFVRIFELAKISTEGERDPDFATEAAVSLEAFVLRLCRSLNVESKQSSAISAAEYRRIVSSMTDTVCENLSLSEIAQRNHISVSYVKILFQRYAGVSPKSYYSSLRAAEAAKMLSDGMSVSEVADRMKFSSPNYFEIFFKRQMGITPGKYKNRKNP